MAKRVGATLSGAAIVLALNDIRLHGLTMRNGGDLAFGYIGLEPGLGEGAAAVWTLGTIGYDVNKVLSPSSGSAGAAGK